MICMFFYKQSQAMRIVRTVGQAFEVCHKLSNNGPGDNNNQHLQVQPSASSVEDGVSEEGSEPFSDRTKKGTRQCRAAINFNNIT